ncbi:hypothetical protein HOLDEFILI_02258 [Holdemania filiformis DSM 12042]|uniref:Uncharacterized protein n=1 Tax=Holdemania filiformis DSM 12042 TaxID=545696 RepID=B9Y8V8_9FIRM|nr:hypothetical protein HOLDEFILI_02258 [Holdemania filiformis DSM 12042]
MDQEWKKLRSFPVVSRERSEVRILNSGFVCGLTELNSGSRLPLSRRKLRPLRGGSR